MDFTRAPRAANFPSMPDERPPDAPDDVAARDPNLVRPVPPELAAGLDLDRFKREIAFVSSRLENPNILPLFGASENEGAISVTMPRTGEPLDMRIARDGALPVADVMRFLRDIAAALAHGHERGVLHRALKPSNVMLADGNALVAEFGVARAADAARFTRPDPSIDNRTDIRDLGFVGYEMLTGHAPVADPATGVIPPIRTLRPGVPTALADLVTRCMAPHADDRPQTAAEIVAKLDDMITPIDGLLTTLWPGESDTLQARAEYYKRRGIAAVSIVIIAMLVLGWIAARSSSGKDAARRIIGASAGPSPSADSMRTDSTRAAAAAGPVRGTTNDTAIADYNRGLAAAKQNTDAGLHEAILDFQHAVAADPRFAAGWAELADTWLRLSDTFVAPKDAVPQARDAVARGLAFDSTNASLLFSRGVIAYLYNRNAKAAQGDMGRAVAADPTIPLAARWYPAVLWTNGLRDSAKAFERAAVLRDSANVERLTDAWTYARTSGNALEALEYCGKLRVLHASESCDAMQQLDVSNPDAELARAERAAKAAGERNTTAQLAYVYALVTAQRLDEAKRVVAAVDEQSGIPGSYMREDDIALMHGWIGDAPGALSWLNRALVAGSAGVGALYWRTALNPIRTDPRLLEFAQRAGLGSPPSYWR